MKNIVIFASGTGSNALTLIRHFRDSETIRVKAVFTNVVNAGVVEKAIQEDVPVVTFTRAMSDEPSELDVLLDRNQPDLIVLAGYLWLFPARIIQKYPGKIINLHPALLPKYGGKGMWGKAVHDAVLKNGETESGISIHFVNEKYDAGQMIAQAKCPVLPGDTPDRLAGRIHELEYRLLPEVVEELLK